MTAPSSPAEWQDTVDLAETCLLIESARLYGLVIGGPVVNSDRCVEVLERGAALGYVPTDTGVERCIAAFATVTQKNPNNVA